MCSPIWSKVPPLHISIQLKQVFPFFLPAPQAAGPASPLPDLSSFPLKADVF